jgi:hypothetical protein
MMTALARGVDLATPKELHSEPSDDLPPSSHTGSRCNDYLGVQLPPTREIVAPGKTEPRRCGLPKGYQGPFRGLHDLG